MGKLTLSLLVRRNLVLLAVIVAAVLAVNSLLGLRWFGDFDKQVAYLGFGLAYLVHYFFGLNREEWKALRNRQQP